MPNVSGPDFVPLHKHDPADVPGLAVALCPPIQSASPTTSAPTTSSATYATLAEMSIPVTPPNNPAYPLWQATIEFSGTFSNSTDAAGAAIKLQQDGSDIANTTRSGASAGANGPFTLSVRRTVVIPAGTPATFTAVWACPGAVGTATAVGTNRSMSVKLQPYVPAAI